MLDVHVPPLSARCAGAVWHTSTHLMCAYTLHALIGEGGTIYSETCTSLAEVQRRKGNCTCAEHRNTIDLYLCRLTCACACDGNHFTYLCQVQIVRALQPWAPRALQVMKQFLTGSLDPNNIPTPNLGISFIVLVPRYHMLVPGHGNNSSEHLGLYLAQGTEVQVICPCDL